MESTSGLVVFTHEDLNTITGGFNEENRLGDTQYGAVFRGKFQHELETIDVVVKIWVEDSKIVTSSPERQLSRLKAEIKLLTKPDMKCHPNMVKLIGYCPENGRLGVVYELNPLDTIQKLILQDDFKWISRINVAIQFARLLQIFHDQELWLHNISAEHLIVDHVSNPILCDFSMLVGGDFGGISNHEYECGSYGYSDPYVYDTGRWSDKTDVFAYGIILLGLIAKRVYDKKECERLEAYNYVDIWAWEEYKKNPKPKLWGKNYKSLVHNSLESDPFFVAGDGVKITRLAMRCMERLPKQRPTMKEVVRCLQKLKCGPEVDLNPKISVGY